MVSGVHSCTWCGWKSYWKDNMWFSNCGELNSTYWVNYRMGRHSFGLWKLLQQDRDSQVQRMFLFFFVLLFPLLCLALLLIFDDFYKLTVKASNFYSSWEWNICYLDVIELMCEVCWFWILPPFSFPHETVWIWLWHLWIHMVHCIQECSQNISWRCLV